MEPKDSIVAAVIAKFQQRSALGIAKYGTTLDRTDLKPLDWIKPKKNSWSTCISKSSNRNSSLNKKPLSM